MKKFWLDHQHEAKFYKKCTSQSPTYRYLLLNVLGFRPLHFQKGPFLFFVFFRNVFSPELPRGGGAIAPLTPSPRLVSATASYICLQNVKLIY